MNKSELIKSLSEKSGLTVKDSQKAYDSLIEVLTEALKAKDKVSLTGFATIELREKPAREGLNPLTKQKIQIPASFAPHLKFGKSFKEEFNK